MLLRQGHQRKRSAFTLMEIIVVVAIILILASAAVVVVPRFLDDANISRAKMDVKTIEKAVVAYKVKHNRYPPDLRTLGTIQEDGGPAYIDPANLIDPWGQEYQYNPDQLNPNTRYPLIYSNGPGGNTPPIKNWNDQQ